MPNFYPNIGMMKISVFTGWTPLDNKKLNLVTILMII